jgi:Zn-dependent peptidase ImmA (M78 family)
MSLQNSFQEKFGLEPEVYAREVLIKLNINSLPIDPKFVAEKLGFQTDEKPFPQDNVDGFLIRGDDGGFIVVNQNIQYESRKRFTYGHELGHAYLPWHRSQSEFRCTKLHIAGVAGDPIKEKEANAFAAELMMPRQFFEQDVARTPFKFDDLEKLAEEKYLTSLQATALRYVNFTLESCAVVLVHNGTILWSYSSKSFKERVRMKHKVTDLTYAYDFFASGTLLEGKPKEVLAKAWVETNDPNRLIIEQSKSFSDLNLVLALLEFPAKAVENLDDIFTENEGDSL